MVMFDMDGTIGDTLPMCDEAFKRAVEPYLQRAMTEEEIVKLYGVNEEGMFQLAAGGHWREAIEDFYGYYAEMHEAWCPAPFKGMRELLGDLKAAGKGLALVTGKGAECCRMTLERFGLAEGVFDFVETGAPDRNRKPEAIRSILERSGVKAEEAVYVGDTVSDVEACREAGTECLSAAWAKSARREALEAANAGRVVGSVQELRRRLGMKEKRLTINDE